MQRGLCTASEQTIQTIRSPTATSPTQYGLDLSRPGASFGGSEPDCLADASCDSCHASGDVSREDALQKLDAKLRRVSTRNTSSAKKALAKNVSVAGKRISEYEQALTPVTPRRGHGGSSLDAIMSPGSPSQGVQLVELPNEVLTHIFSYLHLGSHGSIALVSRRFYSLITTPHVWRMAFVRFFPGCDVGSGAGTTSPYTPGADADVRWEAPRFARLTVLGSWRSEYLLRTRLLRSMASGKPGPNARAPSDGGRTGKKATAVITYNSHLPWMVDRLHAMFSSTGKKAARVVHGASELGVASASNPAIGKLEAWGVHEQYTAAQLDEVFPMMQPFGLGDGPAAGPNVMDVSQLYGAVVGEGVPGGRPLYRAMGSQGFGYLESHGRNHVTEQKPSIPSVPEETEAVSAVWLAKTAAVPAVTQSMVAMLAGTTMGVVSAYSLGRAESASRYSHNQVTARWAVSPGVPIVAIEADDSFSEKRRASGRVWAVALTALGEVYCLRSVPDAGLRQTSTVEPGQRLSDVQEVLAWQAGRTAQWELVPATRRTPRADWSSAKDLTRALAASPWPRSEADAGPSGQAKLEAKARDTERFFALRPDAFRAVYEDDWDMRQRLEVDFAGGDSSNSDSAGENVFVLRCGIETQGRPASVTRFTRTMDVGWQTAEFSLPSSSTGIMCSAVDRSTVSVATAFEDTLVQQRESGGADYGGELPGRRARWMAIGTRTGSVAVWNMREMPAGEAPVRPLSVVQTDSPAVTSVAVSALVVVHGGSDGLVQAWDPLGSVDPAEGAAGSAAVRTLHGRTLGRVPRHVATGAGAVLTRAHLAEVRAMFLDPDPTVLRGVLAAGTLLRFWSYSTSQVGHMSRKQQRRVRHATADGQLVSRRAGVRENGFIAAETAELRRERLDDERHRARLRARFGVGLVGLTDEEAVRYAEILSQEEALLDAAGGRDGGSSTEQTVSLSSSAGTETQSLPGEASSIVFSPSTPTVAATPSETAPSTPLSNSVDDDLELQIQRAIRLSLLEAGHDDGPAEYAVTYRSKGKAAATSTPLSAPVSASVSPPVLASASTIAFAWPQAGSSAAAAAAATSAEDEDLQLALALSLQEEDLHQQRQQREEQEAADAALAAALSREDEFPALEVKGKGKSRRV